MSELARYHAKRNFKRTPEPDGSLPRAKSDLKPELSGGIFVVHKHAARRLHYDLRLEVGGVLWSWAVTRGPSLNPDEKRLAVHVENHPLDYAGFEGTIPKGEYGAGAVIIWDQGHWSPEFDPLFGMEKGHLSFQLQGQKLTGQWHLVRLKPRKSEKGDNWLLMKVRDSSSASGADVLKTAPASVRSGLLIEDVARGVTETVGPSTQPPSRAAKTTSSTPQKPDLQTGLNPRRQPALPAFIRPCLAQLQTKPPSGEQWLHEVKFDGYRLQARIDHGKVQLLTRSGLDWTERFGPQLAAAFSGLDCKAALIDGEAVVLGENGIAAFSALQNALSDGKTGAIVFFGFDLLHLDGVDLTSEPLIARKAALEDLLGAASEGILRLSEHFTAPGETMLRHACRMGMEGVVSKRAQAPYRSGRGTDWLKSKCIQRQEFVIGGYLPAKGSGHSLGSLVVGYHEAGTLKHAGRVGTGFSARTATELKARLDRLASPKSAFAGTAKDERGVVWVKPELVAEIEFRAWTDAKILRHASFVALRDDKLAVDVIAEVAGDDVDREPAKALGSDTKTPPAKTPITSVRISNPGKILWPDANLTKQGLLDYYTLVWPLMRSLIVDRPLSLLRAPDGIDGHHFFQKHASPGMHRAIHRVSDKDGKELIFIQDFDGLAALVQLGTVEIHLWGSRIDVVEKPDQLIFDLDPDDAVPLKRVGDAAIAVRGHLREMGFDSWLKTSGGKGYHVMVPVKPETEWDRVKAFTRDFAKALEQESPRDYTATLAKAARKGRIFVDYLRNGRGATAIAPYSTRARQGAPVSVPVEWDELESDLTPDFFNVQQILKNGIGTAMVKGHKTALMSAKMRI